MTSSVTPVGSHNLQTNHPQMKGHPHHQFTGLLIHHRYLPGIKCFMVSRPREYWLK
jgi:hypothetical protein